MLKYPPSVRRVYTCELDVCTTQYCVIDHVLCSKPRARL